MATRKHFIKEFKPEAVHLLGGDGGQSRTGESGNRRCPSSRLFACEQLKQRWRGVD